MSRHSVVTITVTGEPAQRLKYQGYGERERHTYEVVEVIGTFHFSGGNFSKVLWGGFGRLLKKDGSLGRSLSKVRWDFEPDQQTQREFADTAKQQLNRAAHAANKRGVAW